MSQPDGLTLLIVLTVITACSCRSAENNTTQPTELESLVWQALGRESKIVLNDSKTYALCQQKPQDDHLKRKFKYIVVRVSDKSVVKEGYYSAGYVKWHNNDSIEVFSSEPSEKEDSGTKKIIHVNSQP